MGFREERWDVKKTEFFPLLSPIYLGSSCCLPGSLSPGQLYRKERRGQERDPLDFFSTFSCISRVFSHCVFFSHWFLAGIFGQTSEKLKSNPRHRQQHPAPPLPPPSPPSPLSPSLLFSFPPPHTPNEGKTKTIALLLRLLLAARTDHNFSEIGSH